MALPPRGWLLILSASLLAVGLAADAAFRDHVRLGAPGSISPSPLLLGAVAPLAARGDRFHEAQEMMNAWALLLQDLNSRGGLRINGSSVLLSLVVVDEAEAASLPGENVSLVLGPWADAQVESVLSVLGEQDMVVLGTGSPADAGASSYFNLYSLHADLVLSTLLRTLPGDVTRLAVLVEEAYEDSCVNASITAAGFGKSLVLSAALPSSAGSLSAAGAEAAVLCASCAEVARFVQSMKTAQYSLQAVLLASCHLDELQLLIGMDAAWLIGDIRIWPNATGPNATFLGRRDFVKAYEARFGSAPGAAASWAHEALLELVQAVLAAVSPAPAAVAARLGAGAEVGIWQLQASPDVPQVVFPPEVSEVPPVIPMPSWAERACTLTPNSSTIPRFSSFGFDSSGTCVTCPERTEARFDSTRQRRLCSSCEAGRIFRQLSVNESRCERPCSEGQVEDLAGQCQPCLAGYFAEPSSLGSVCTPCAKGETSAPGGNCTSCASGDFGVIVASPECQSCPAGFISAGAGEITCTPCPAGHFTPQAGRSVCEHCGEGSVAERAGRSACTVCSPGRFSASFGLSCKACAMGSFQPSWGQTLCVEDTVGLISPTSGRRQPDNEAGYYALWDPATNITEFAVEHCSVRPKACLSAGRCADGATGRHCFACMPGRGSSPDCYTCLPRQIYLAIAITAFVACVATYVMCAVALVHSASTSPHCHMVLLKMMLNHCAAISVLSSAFFRAAMRMGYSDPLMQRLVAFLAVTDGTPPSDNWLFSLTCLVQPWRSKALDEQMEELTGVFHSEYFSETRARARQTLVDFQWWTEMRLLLCWAATPVVAVALVLLLLLIRLRLYMSARSEFLNCSGEFYTQVYFFGWEPAQRLWEIEISEELLAVYNTRLWGICWPLHHVKAWLRAQKLQSTSRNRGLLSSCCGSLLVPLLFVPRWLVHGVDLRRFWVESAPLRMVMLYCLYFSVARRSMRALHCIWLGGAGQMDRAVMYNSGAVRCGWSQSLHYGAFFLGFVWAAMWPAWAMYDLYRIRRRGKSDVAERRYAVLLLGFSHTRWWWEAAVFLRKFCFILLEAVPLEERLRFLLFTCMGLLALLAQLISNPCDRRWHGLLTQMEIAHLVIIILISILSYLAIFEVLGFQTVVVCFAALHVGFMVVALGCLADAATMMLAGTLDPQKVQLRGDDGLLTRTLQFLLRLKQRREAMQPYIAYDNVHRFVSVVGRGGDQATPPYFPSGAELFLSQADPQTGAAVVRTKLSEVGFQRVLEGRRTVSLLSAGKRGLFRSSARKEYRQRFEAFGAKVPVALRRQVARQLLFTAEHLAKTTSTTSISILDFVVRAIFMIVFDSRTELDDGPRELDRSVWVEAYRRRDIVYLVSADKDERSGPENPQAKRLEPRGLLLERDLQQLEEMVFSWDHWELCQQVAAHRDLVDDGRPLTRQDFERAAQALQQPSDKESTAKEGPSDSDSDILSASSQDSAAATRIRSVEDVRRLHETLEKKVARMFSRKIFRRGLTLHEMKHALTKLRQTPLQELKLWLDIFERSWFSEFMAVDKELHQLAGTHLENSMNVKFSEIMSGLPRPERRDRNSRHASEELNLTVCLKWVRFVLHYYCGGIQVVQLGDVMRTRLTRPNRRMIRESMELQALQEDSDEEEGVLSLGALARADRGIDVFLGGLPDEDAMERADRGISRALKLSFSDLSL